MTLLNILYRILTFIPAAILILILSSVSCKTLDKPDNGSIDKPDISNLIYQIRLIDTNEVELLKLDKFPIAPIVYPLSSTRTVFISNLSNKTITVKSIKFYGKYATTLSIQPNTFILPPNESIEAKFIYKPLENQDLAPIYVVYVDHTPKISPSDIMFTFVNPDFTEYTPPAIN